MPKATILGSDRWTAVNYTPALAFAEKGSKKNRSLVTGTAGIPPPGSEIYPTVSLLQAWQLQLSPFLSVARAGTCDWCGAGSLVYCIGVGEEVTGPGADAAHPNRLSCIWGNGKCL